MRNPVFVTQVLKVADSIWSDDEHIGSISSGSQVLTDIAARCLHQSFQRTEGLLFTCKVPVGIVQQQWFSTLAQYAPDGGDSDTNVDWAYATIALQQLHLPPQLCSFSSASVSRYEDSVDEPDLPSTRPVLDLPQVVPDE
jgi:hypothetical protein